MGKAVGDEIPLGERSAGEVEGQDVERARGLQSWSVMRWKWYPMTARVMAVEKERRWRVAAVRTKRQ